MLKDIAGYKFGQLTVIQRSGTRNHQALWKCLCTCGNTVDVRGSSLRSGDTQSCGCVWSEKSKLQVARLHEQNVKPDAPRNFVLSQYKSKSPSRGLEFTLSDKEFDEMISKPCYWCGDPPSNSYTSEGGHTLRYSGIDRLDSNEGYIAENCVPCCKICNFMKGVKTPEEFLDKLFQIAKVHEERK